MPLVLGLIAGLLTLGLGMLGAELLERRAAARAARRRTQAWDRLNRFRRYSSTRD